MKKPTRTREDIEQMIRAHESQMQRIEGDMAQTTSGRALDIYQENWEKHARSVAALKQELAALDEKR